MKFLPKLRFIRLAVCLCMLLSFSATYAQTFTPRYNTKVITKVNGYYEYLPQGYCSTCTTLYPTIICLSGIGEMGDGSTNTTTGLPKLLTSGLPKYIQGGSFPVSFTIPGTTTTKKFIVIAPQFKSPNFSPYPTPKDLDSVITYVASHYKVDKTRIYLTGYSSGGGLNWDYGGYSTTYANRIAAMVPIAGGTNDSLAKKARTITKSSLPVWATHNYYDPSVYVKITYRWVDSINKAPSPNPLARKTIFQASGHDAWTKTYDKNYRETIGSYSYNIYEWMLRYKRATYYQDYDKDGYGNSSIYKSACTAQSGYVTIKGDCNDKDASIHPGATEITGNSIDENCNGSLTTSSMLEGITATEENNLSVQVLPNPSYTYFTLKIESNSNNLLQVRVLDAVGKTVEVRSNMVKGSLTLGQSYKPGMYYVEVIQGNQRAIVKCIKQAQ